MSAVTPVSQIPLQNANSGAVTLTAKYGRLEVILDAAGATSVQLLVQGEGGFIPASFEYMRRLRQLCDKYGILLIADEVQCGYGRTGKMWAFEHAGIVPDVVTRYVGEPTRYFHAFHHHLHTLAFAVATTGIAAALAPAGNAQSALDEGPLSRWQATFIIAGLFLLELVLAQFADLLTSPGAGTALVHSNMIAEAPRGAVVGLDHARPITTDLTADGAQRYAQVAIGPNSVRR